MVTGGAGFIGSNFVRWVVESQLGVTVTVPNSLTYVGKPANIVEVPAVTARLSKRALFAA